MSDPHMIEGDRLSEDELCGWAEWPGRRGVHVYGPVLASTAHEALVSRARIEELERKCVALAASDDLELRRIEGDVLEAAEELGVLIEHWISEGVPRAETPGGVPHSLRVAVDLYRTAREALDTHNEPECAGCGARMWEDDPNGPGWRCIDCGHIDNDNREPAS